jgi:putative hydrolase of the HAD superfamily
MNQLKKYLIWDFDGTLAWRPGGWAGALLSVLRRKAPDNKATAETIRPYLQKGFPWHAPENAHPGLAPLEWWEDLLPIFARAYRGAGLDNSQAAVLARDVRSAYIDPAGWQLYHDSRAALQNLSTRGWTHLLLTNHVPELPFILDRLEICDFFSGLFNSAETGYEKPNPKAFRAVLDWIGAKGPATMIGDNYTADILGAGEVGLPAILVRQPHPDAKNYCRTLLELEQVI